VAFLALFEVAGVASVLPFMALLADPEQISQNELLRTAYEFGGFANKRAFIVAAGVTVIVLLALSRLLAVLISYWRERFQWGVYFRTSCQLLDFYVDRPYRYFLEHNTADLRGYILVEVMNIVTAYLAPIITLMISGGMALTIILLVFFVDPLVAGAAAVLFGGAYLLIYRLRKRPIIRLGDERHHAAMARYRVLEELLQGIKTVKTYGNQHHFTARYRKDTAVLVRVLPRLRILFQTPKFLLEVLAFCGIIGITLVLYLRTGDLGKVLPTLTLFAVAGYRLLPALQEVFGAYATMRANRNVLDKLYPDLTASLAHAKRQTQTEMPLPFRKNIQAESVTFQFPNTDTPLFQELSVSIPHGQITAFVGATGSGKTTLVDLLTGLLQPTSGEITVDGIPLTSTTLSAWRQQLAYVPQEVFLYDASLRDNIVFGHSKKVTEAELMDLLQLVELDAFVREEMTDGLDTLLGENGVRLSGGQRQRVGLARALLREPSVLILDEATSSLDTITERAIIRALRRLPAGMTVLIIAHRLSTVRDADQIHLLDNGRILASGTFVELIENNEQFRLMEELSRS